MRKPRAISENEDFPVKPSDINAAEYMWDDAFGNIETDLSAGYIVRFMQEKGDWVPFSFGEINSFYRNTCTDRRLDENYGFNHLIGKLRVVRAGDSYWDRMDVMIRVVDENKNLGNFNDGTIFQVTDEFILRCYLSAGIPRVKSVATPAC